LSSRKIAGSTRPATARDLELEAVLMAVRRLDYAELLFAPTKVHTIFSSLENERIEKKTHRTCELAQAEISAYVPVVCEAKQDKNPARHLGPSATDCGCGIRLESPRRDDRQHQ
jgi:hypothetical protein